MALYKPAFKELAASLADEVAYSRRHSIYQADRGAQLAQSVATSDGEHDAFGVVTDGIFQDESQIFVEDWLEAQLLDCQNLAQRHGLTKLSRILDEALDALREEGQGLIGSPEDWQTRSQQ